jgi:hypothetical protein
MKFQQLMRLSSIISAAQMGLSIDMVNVKAA